MSVCQEISGTYGLSSSASTFPICLQKIHSTETALLRVHSDIIHALDGKKCVHLILFDLSTAFNTIDHDILLDRLKSLIGLSGKVYGWFCSYIWGRKQSLLINGIPSTFLGIALQGTSKSASRSITFYHLHLSTQWALKTTWNTLS